MYSNTKSYATFFKSTLDNTDKITHGRVSIPMKTSRKDESGKDIYGYESWNVRFIGKAREKALTLTEWTRITLTNWSAHPGYNKEKKQCYPYLLVTDFEIREQGASADSADTGDYMIMDDEDAQLPF